MAEESSPTRSRRGTRRRPNSTGAAGFYAAALSEAERVLLPQARKMEGLDEEIALLRVRLKAALEEHPEDLPLLLKCLELLVKAVAAKYRLSKKAEDDLYQNVLGVLRGIGGALWPEGFDGV